MSTPITNLTLYRTKLAPDGTVMDGIIDAYLAQCHPFSVADCTFQRQHREMRLPLSMDIAGRYNYATFINNGRKFYCFVTDMEYVNDNMTKASYTIDYWHTYRTDIEYCPTIIEREIIPKSEDVLMANVQDEPVTVNRWEIASMDSTFDDGVGWNYLLMDNGTQSSPDASATRYGNMAYAAHMEFEAFPSVIVSRLNDIVRENDNALSIQGCWAIPLSSTIPGTPDTAPSEWEMIVSVPANPSGYMVANKKTLSSPYCFVGIFSSDGVYQSYDLQDIFNQQTGSAFYFDGTLSLIPQPEMLVCPKYISGGSLNNNQLRAVTLSGFPRPNLSANATSITNEIALTAKKRALVGTIITTAGNTAAVLPSAVNSVGFGVAGIASGNVGMGALGALSGIGQMASQVGTLINAISGASASKQYRETHMKEIAGTVSGGSGALWARNAIGITICMFVPSSDQVRMVDTFFTRFGYAVNKLALPRLHSRTNWDFIKTNNAEFTIPNAPVEAEAYVNKLFNSGVTIWHQYANFKDYSIAND